MLKRKSLAFVLVSCLSALPLPAQTRELAAPQAASEVDPKSRFEWVGTVTPVERAIAECLRESRRTAPDEMGKLLRRIVTPPKGKVEACLSILVQGRVPKVAPDDGPQKLSVPQRELVLAALGALPEKETRAGLAVLAAGELDESKARTVVEVLGVVGTARDLKRLAPLLPRDEAGDMPRASQQVLTATYSKILGRDENAMLEFATVLRGRDDLISELVLLALADRRDPRALGPCFEVARSRPTLAQTAVSLLPSFTGSLDVELRAEVAAWLRSATDPARLQWTRAVYDALAAYDDGEALPELIEALDGSERALADAAALDGVVRARVQVERDRAPSSARSPAERGSRAGRGSAEGILGPPAVPEPVERGPAARPRAPGSRAAPARLPDARGPEVRGIRARADAEARGSVDGRGRGGADRARGHRGRPDAPRGAGHGRRSAFRPLTFRAFIRCRTGPPTRCSVGACPIVPDLDDFPAWA
jgi:citrate lyase gamma subunit